MHQLGEHLFNGFLICCLAMTIWIDAHREYTGFFEVFSGDDFFCLGHFLGSIPEVIGSISAVIGQNFQPAQCGFHSE